MTTKFADVLITIPGTLRGFDPMLGKVSRTDFAARLLERLAERPRLTAIVWPVPRIHAILPEQHEISHRPEFEAVRARAVCRQPLAVPGVSQ